MEKIALSHKIFSKKLKILLCEDEPCTMEQIELFLKNRYDHVFTAKDGKEGLLLFYEQLPDIVITDVNMPHTNGLELAYEIKRTHKETQVIIVTAFTETDYMLKAIDIGVDQYVTKPMDPKKLTAALEKCVNMVYSKEAKRVEEELRLQEAIISSKTAILQDIAHHWRNPLNNIVISCELMQERLKETACSDSELFEYAASVKRVSFELSETIADFSDMFSYSQLEKEFDIKKTLESCLIKCFIGFEAIDVELSFESNDKNYTLKASRGVFESIIYALIKNSMEALKRTKKDNPKISISLKEEEEFYILDIKDNGGGIDEGIFHSICDPYISTKKQGHGYGLGLFTARLMLDKHLHGAISWKNEDDGARFVLNIKKG